MNRRNAVLHGHYLAGRDHLLLAPSDIGPSSRASVDFFVLEKDLRGGLTPLGVVGFEGLAIGPNDKMPWQQIASELQNIDG